jgi:hypothetical protein
MMYVVETDAPCTHCGVRHLYATKMCTLVVWVDEPSARLAAKQCDGIVRLIDRVPEDPSNPGELIPHVIYLHKNGRPDPNLPAVKGRIG